MMSYMPEVYPSVGGGINVGSAPKSTHGIELPVVGGNIKDVKVSKDVDPEIAGAAYDDKQAVIVHEGNAYLAPMDAIDPEAVELACNTDGCALIPDDGNPDNDLTPEMAKDIHSPAHNDEWVSF